jgi:hypothetical protein
MAGVGVAVASIGLVQLLSLVLDQITASGGSVISGDRADVRDRLSLALSMIAVGTPVWLVHWWFAERAARHGTAGAGAERSAALRAFYLALVEFVTLVIALFAASGAIETLFRQVAGALEGYGGTFSDPAALAFVGVMGWGYHAWIRGGDELSGELRGPAAWLPRLARYALAFIAGLMLCLGAAELIELSSCARGTRRHHQRPGMVDRTGRLGRRKGRCRGRRLGRAVGVIEPPSPCG